MPDDDDLPSNSRYEVVARAVNLLIGRGGYETVRRLYEDERVDFCDGARIIASSGPETQS